MFTAPDGGPEEGPADAVVAATSEPETKGPSPLADRPDIVAAKQGVRDHNQRCADQLRLMIEETGGWYDALPSPDIFDKFQAWAVAKYGRPFEEYTKHRLSKVLVDQLGATWHKTGKGRMYQLPEGLRPSSRPASEDFPVVPVGPAPTTPAPAPGGLRVVADPAVPRGNVYFLQQRPTHVVDATAPQGPELVFDGGVVRPAGQDQEGRCIAWLLAKGLPATQCELPDGHDLAETDHRGGGYWWAGDRHGRLEEDGPAPFVDFPETTAAGGGEISVTEGGVFGADGERLPGDEDAPAAVANLADLTPAETAAVAAGDYDEEMPADVEIGVGEAAAAIAEEEAAWQVEQARLEAARPDKPLTVVHTEGEIAAARNSYAVGLESGLVAAAQPVVTAAPLVQLENVEAPVIHELPADPALPEGARLCSVQLTEEQIGWPLRRIAAIFDDFAGRQGLVRLGALADIELRKIMSQRYATAMVCPAGNVAAVPAGPAAESFQAAINDAIAAGPVAPVEGPQKFAVPITAEEAVLPFGALEELFVSRLPEGLVNSGAPVELVTNPATGGPGVMGMVRGQVAGSEEGLSGALEAAAAGGPVGASVTGEDLQGLVAAPDAAADALAAYRAASRGLSVPDHVTDDGDWG